MRVGYLGRDGKASKMKKVYIGVNGIARQCVKAYVGVNGIARYLYPGVVSIPTVSGSYTYDGTVHEAVISDYDEDAIAVSGTTSTPNAGTHYVTFTLKSPHYTWENGTKDPISLPWVVNSKVITIPALSGSYTYNGDRQYVSYSAVDPNEIIVSGDTYGTIARNDYTVYFTLNNLQGITNYKWIDNSSSPKSAIWAIARKAIDVPTLSKSTTVYSGGSQSVTAQGYSDNEVNIVNPEALSGTNVNTYTVYFDLKDTSNLIWKNYNDTLRKSASWQITKAPLNVPIVTSDLTYNGNAKSPTITGFDSNTMIKSGDSQTNAGNYNVTFSLKDKVNYQWNVTPATSDDQLKAWSIAKASLNVPMASGSYIYNGSSKTVTLNGFNSNTMTKSGDTQINAGNYNVTVALIDKNNYQWNTSPVTTDNQQVPWSIQKANADIAIGSWTKIEDESGFYFTVKLYAKTAYSYEISYTKYNGFPDVIRGDTIKGETVTITSDLCNYYHTKSATAKITLKDQNNYEPISSTNTHNF